MKPSLLELAELKVVDALAEAWNAFLALPTEHGDEQLEFRLAIHRAQHIILSRPASRALRASNTNKEQEQ
jgi:hypothetical protein